MKVLYSQCWEDPQIVRDGLKIRDDDDILSIASGGDNSIALLLDNPRSILAVDRNSSQIALVELKIVAIKNLPYETVIDFLGVRANRHRIAVYKTLRVHLTRETKIYWDNNLALIEKGIIHIGKFERYFSIFNKYLLPLIHSKKTIIHFLSLKSPEKQKEFYTEKWNNLRWRCLFHLFFSRFILSRLGRTSSFFENVTKKNIAEILYSRTEHGLRNVLISDNYYLKYILSGCYSDTDCLPVYLQRKNFKLLKSRIDRIQLICDDLENVIDSLPDNSVSKYNFSDAFEYMDNPTKQNFLKKIIRISRHNARLAVWTLFVEQSIPDNLKNQICTTKVYNLNHHSKIKTFFYNTFNVWEMKKL